MATLYDIELSESNNYIQLLKRDGFAPSLQLMLDQRKMAESMGPAGAALLATLDDPNSDIGKSVIRLKALQIDVSAEMKAQQLLPEQAAAVEGIFSRNPDSLEVLSDQERAILQDYWIKKKATIAKLIAKGYEYRELFS